MSEILGYDIDGQPLRAGDRVVIVRVEQNIFSSWIGLEVTIKGHCDENPGYLAFMEKFYGADVCSVGSMIRKLPPKKADNETTTWESIEQLTGWVPERVVA